MAAMTLFFGVMIGTMAFGHLLAVTTKLALGTLEGSILVFYVIDAALADPLLEPHPSHAEGARLRRRAWAGDAGAQRLAGNHAPGAGGSQPAPRGAELSSTSGYHLHSRRVVGWAIVSLAVVVNVGLFIGIVDIPGERPEFRAIQTRIE